MNDEFIGSNFDDFLTEEGLLEEVEAVVVKRVLAFQIKELMETQNLSKAEWRAACAPAAPPWNACLTRRTTR
jgi:hypothetical protein